MLHIETSLGYISCETKFNKHLPSIAKAAVTSVDVMVVVIIDIPEVGATYWNKMPVVVGIAYNIIYTWVVLCTKMTCQHFILPRSSQCRLNRVS